MVSMVQYLPTTSNPRSCGQLQVASALVSACFSFVFLHVSVKWMQVPRDLWSLWVSPRALHSSHARQRILGTHTRRTSQNWYVVILFVGLLKISKGKYSKRIWCKLRKHITWHGRYICTPFERFPKAGRRAGSWEAFQWTKMESMTGESALWRFWSNPGIPSNIRTFQGPGFVVAHAFSTIHCRPQQANAMSI